MNRPMALALLDTNVLIHAADQRASLHAAAARLVDRGLRERGVYCIAPQNLIEFAAVVTRPRLAQIPLPTDHLLRMANTLFRSRRLAKIYPRRGTVIRAVQQGAALGITGPRWYDLFLAVTMQDAGVEVVVTENVNDFRRIPFVTARNLGSAE